MTLKIRFEWTTVLTVLIILTSVMADAARDALLNKVTWWEWYVIKWLAFFPPLIVLWLRIRTWAYRVLVVAMSLAMWKFVYNFLK